MEGPCREETWKYASLGILEVLLLEAGTGETSSEGDVLASVSASAKQSGVSHLRIIIQR